MDFLKAVRFALLFVMTLAIIGSFFLGQRAARYMRHQVHESKDRSLAANRSFSFLDMPWSNQWFRLANSTHGIYNDDLVVEDDDDEEAALEDAEKFFVYQSMIPHSPRIEMDDDDDDDDDDMDDYPDEVNDVSIDGAIGKQSFSTSDAETQRRPAVLKDIKSAEAQFEAYLDQLVSESVNAPEESQVRNVAFLKTHKTGSSTVGSIMFRFAARHDLTLPVVDHNIHVGRALRRRSEVERFRKGNHSQRVAAPSSSISSTAPFHCQVALQHVQSPKWRFAREWYRQAVFRSEADEGVVAELTGGSKKLSGFLPLFDEKVHESQLPFNQNQTPLLSGPLPMPKTPRAALITILREPIAHYASWAHFYKLPELRAKQEKALGSRIVASSASPQYQGQAPDAATLEAFVQSSRARRDPMAHSIGLFKEEELQGFVDEFTIVLLLERLEEGLVLLKRRFGWKLIDITYFSINDSHRGESKKMKGLKSTSPSSSHSPLLRSWDGLPVVPSPRPENMSRALRDRIHHLTQRLDQPLYALAVKKYQRALANERAKRYGSQTEPSFTEDLEEFRRLQRRLRAHCEPSIQAIGGRQLTRVDFSDGGEWFQYLRYGWLGSTVATTNTIRVTRERDQQNSSHNSLACRWYRLSDLQYEKQIRNDGKATAISFSN